MYIADMTEDEYWDYLDKESAARMQAIWEQGDVLILDLNKVKERTAQIMEENK